MADLIKLNVDGYIPEKEKGKGVVYVLEIDDGTIKIGNSMDFKNRLKGLKKQYMKYDKHVLRYACTDNIRGFIFLEEFLHMGLDQYNVYTPVNCESYSIPFDIAVNYAIPYTVYFLNQLYNFNVI